MIQGLRTKGYARLTDVQRLLAESSSYGELFSSLKKAGEVAWDAPGTQENQAVVWVQGACRQL